MYSVIKSEKKFFKSNIKTIPDLWIRVKNSEKHFLCPINVSEEQLARAVRNCFQPLQSWQTYKCQILESKFSKLINQILNSNFTLMISLRYPCDCNETFLVFLIVFKSFGKTFREN